LNFTLQPSYRPDADLDAVRKLSLGLQLINKRAAEPGEFADLFQSEDARLREGKHRDLRRPILRVVIHASLRVGRPSMKLGDDFNNEAGANCAASLKTEEKLPRFRVFLFLPRAMGATEGRLFFPWAGSSAVGVSNDVH
jgi:hypothetical protein